MKSVRNMSTREIVAWIKAMDEVYEMFWYRSEEDDAFYSALVHEIVRRGFDLQGNPYPSFYSDRVKLGRAVEQLQIEILKSLEPLLIPVLKWLTNVLRRVDDWMGGVK